MTTPTFDTKAFLEFCRSKPAGEVYDGIDSDRCALAQFGYRRVSLLDFPPEVASAAVFDRPSRERPSDFYTFGALADRLERLVQ
jgi:hypothetical protein